jgi:hypothetical protein
MKKIKVLSYNSEYEFNKALDIVQQNGYKVLTDTFNVCFNWTITYSILVEKEVIDEN